MNRRCTLLNVTAAFLGLIPWTQQATQQKRPVNDALFVQAATVSGLAEISISELASQRVTRDDLKIFCKRMIDDHTQANNELATIARGKQLVVPQSIDARAAFCSQVLAGLTNDEFERCFAKAQLLAHMEALAAFEAEAERGQDAEIKAFASKVVPKIREHIKMIKPVAKELNKDLREEDSSGSKK